MLPNRCGWGVGGGAEYSRCYVQPVILPLALPLPSPPPHLQGLKLNPLTWCLPPTSSPPPTLEEAYEKLNICFHRASSCLPAMSACPLASPPPLLGLKLTARHERLSPCLPHPPCRASSCLPAMSACPLASWMWAPCPPCTSSCWWPGP